MCYSFRPPLFSEMMWVLNFFRFYMSIDIAYFLYIFGDIGATML